MVLMVVYVTFILLLHTATPPCKAGFFIISLIVVVVNDLLVICLYTLEIKIPRQLTTLNVKGAACDLFDVFMGINHRKYS